MSQALLNHIKSLEARIEALERKVGAFDQGATQTLVSMLGDEVKRIAERQIKLEQHKRG